MNHMNNIARISGAFCIQDNLDGIQKLHTWDDLT